MHSLQPHQDGSAYYPLVAILSLGSPVVMDFTPHSSLGQSIETVENNENWNMPPEGPVQMKFAQLSDDYRAFSVLMMPRGLLIFKDSAYSGMLLLHFIVYTSIGSLLTCLSLVARLLAWHNG